MFILKYVCKSYNFQKIVYEVLYINYLLAMTDKSSEQVLKMLKLFLWKEEVLPRRLFYQYQYCLFVN